MCVISFVVICLSRVSVGDFKPVMLMNVSWFIGPDAWPCPHASGEGLSSFLPDQVWAASGASTRDSGRAAQRRVPPTSSFFMKLCLLNSEPRGRAERMFALDRGSDLERRSSEAVCICRLLFTINKTSTLT